MLCCCPMNSPDNPSDHPAPPVPCILLAAGASSRMGRHKLFLPLGDQSIIRHVVLTIMRSARPLIIVTGNAHERIIGELGGLSGIVIVNNPRWETGMVGSAQAGIGALPPGIEGFFLHHGDMPFVTENVFATLAGVAAERAGRGEKPQALVAACRGLPGHPVYFPSSYIPAIRALGDGERLKGVLERLGRINVETGCEGVLEDLDTPDEYRRLRAKYE